MGNEPSLGRNVVTGCRKHCNFSQSRIPRESCWNLLTHCLIKCVFCAHFHCHLLTKHTTPLLHLGLNTLLLDCLFGRMTCYNLEEIMKSHVHLLHVHIGTVRQLQLRGCQCKEHFYFQPISVCRNSIITTVLGITS